MSDWLLTASDWQRLRVIIMQYFTFLDKKNFCHQNFTTWPLFIAWSRNEFHNNRKQKKNWKEFLCKCNPICPNFFVWLLAEKSCLMCGEVQVLHINFPCGHMIKCKRCCNSNDGCFLCWNKTQVYPI